MGKKKLKLIWNCLRLLCTAVSFISVVNGQTGMTPSRLWAAEETQGAVVPAVSAGREAEAVKVASNLLAWDGRPVASIDILGLRRIEKEAVLTKIASKVGKPLSRDLLKQDVQILYAMGYFDEVDIQLVEGDGQVSLQYVLKERPVISKVTYDGNERVSSNDLKDVIKVKEWSILDINKVREDVALIQKYYEDKGYYLAKVSYELKAGKEDEVEVIYKVNDFDKIMIKRITFLNNKRFSDEQLKAVFQETREGNLMSFMTGAGNFKETAFNQDLQRLTLWYLDHGFVKFGHEKPVISVSDDKKYLFISVYLSEGDPYSIGSVDYSGDLLFDKEELNQGLALPSGETFSWTRRNMDIQRLTEKYEDRGFAYVNVIPKMEIREESKTVDIQYAFEKGSPVKFGEINIIGNTKTHDKVIRRELRIHEGELFNGTNLRISRENVERLGFFSPGEVIFNRVTPKGRQDIVNIDIQVKERSTGTVTVGAGFGSQQGFFFTGSLSEMNVFGRGQNVTAQVQWAGSNAQKRVSLGFTDPYAFDTRWSLGGDIFWDVVAITNKYSTRKLGFNLRSGYPLFDYTMLYLSYKHEGLNIFDRVSAYNNDAAVAADSGVLSSVVLNVVRDKRNNRFETSDGNYQSASLEFAGIGGDKQFIKYVLNNRYYKRLIGDLVFRNSTEFGHIFQYTSRPLPPSEKFYLGGPNNMKGFYPFQLGPKAGDFDPNALPANEPLGGGLEFFSLFELEHPLIKEAGLKMVAFFDAGNTWMRWPTGSEPWEIRMDAGVGIRWFSPIGPLRFEWGFPFGRRSGEDSPVFNFFIGPPF
jgi:outer membrane protein insertion porin family